jgi:hypothetical protein
MPYHFTGEIFTVLVEDLLQLKNKQISGITHAPNLENYPDGHIDASHLPAVLSWVNTSSPGAERQLRFHDCEVMVFVEVVGQGTFGPNKARCVELRNRLLADYEIRNDDGSAWLQNDPPVLLIPGSVQAGTVMSLVGAPDGSQYHGFSLTCQVSEHTNNCTT